MYRVRSALAALSVAAILVACGRLIPASGTDPVAQASPTASPSALPTAERSIHPSPAAPVATPRPMATPATLIRAGDPVGFTAPRSVGTLTFTYGGQRWRYRAAIGEVTPVAPVAGEPLPPGTIARARRADGLEATLDASGALRLSDGRPIPAELAAVPLGSVVWSPTGASLAVTDAVTELPNAADGTRVRGGPKVLWVWDMASGAVAAAYRAPDVEDPTGWQPGFGVVSWSPDERFIAISKIVMNSASIGADGYPLALIDRQTRAETDLGTVISVRNWLVWDPPHTAVYVAGGGRETWTNKQLREWSPEGGFRDLTATSEIALAPALSPDAREVLFVTAPVSEYIPDDFFAGNGAGARRLDALDLATGVRRTLPPSEGYVQEGVRRSSDGRARLELRRPLGTMSSPPVPIEVHYVAPDGKAYILLRLPQVAGFGYYGAYPSLLDFEWHEGG